MELFKLQYASTGLNYMIYFSTVRLYFNKSLNHQVRQFLRETSWGEIEPDKTGNPDLVAFRETTVNRLQF